jgi:branched-chain amino acid transport system substrate-binding protein
MHYCLSLTRRRIIQGLAAVAAATALSNPAFAADPLKIGLILPLTGPFASTGKQIEAACRLYIAKNGDTVAGRKVVLIVKDDTGLAPETTKRIAQELVVQDKVSVLAGFGLTPLALAAAPVATEAKVPMIVMAAATGMIPTRSPFIVRTGFTLPQVTGPIAEWAAKNKIKRVVTMVTDYGPGLDAEKTFVTVFKAAGGEVVESIKTPLRNPDYAPFLQRAKDAKPDALFVFVPSGEGLAVMKQFDERGLKKIAARVKGRIDELLVNDHRVWVAGRSEGLPRFPPRPAAAKASSCTTPLGVPIAGKSGPFSRATTSDTPSSTRRPHKSKRSWSSGSATLPCRAP